MNKNVFALWDGFISGKKIHFFLLYSSAKSLILVLAFSGSRLWADLLLLSRMADCVV